MPVSGEQPIAESYSEREKKLFLTPKSFFILILADYS